MTRPLFLMEATSEKPVKPIRTPRRSVPLGDVFKPHEPIPRSYYVAAACLTIAIVFGTWGILSYGGFVKPLFLPSPTEVFSTGVRMIQSGELAENAQVSVLRVVIGWV